MSVGNSIEWEYQYLIYQPMIPGEKLPLIVFLHGAGERGENLNEVKQHGIPKIFDDNTDFPCIAVSPQCPADSFWVAEIPMINEFIKGLSESSLIRWSFDA